MEQVPTETTRPLQRILRRGEVERVTGLSRSSIYELMETGKFPRPIQLTAGGRGVGWLQDEIADYQHARIAERKAA